MQARLRNGSTNPYDRHYLVRCLRAAGDLEQADSVISNFLRAFPLDLDLHLEQARLQLAQGNPTVAEGTMHGATRLSTAKGNPYPYLLLAEKYARDGDDEGVGAALFQAAAVDDTGDTVAFMALTDFLGHDIPDKLRDEVEANSAWPAETQEWVTSALESRHERNRMALRSITRGPSDGDGPLVAGVERGDAVYMVDQALTDDRGSEEANVFVVSGASVESFNGKYCQFHPIDRKPWDNGELFFKHTSLDFNTFLWRGSCGKWCFGDEDSFNARGNAFECTVEILSLRPDFWHPEQVGDWESLGPLEWDPGFRRHVRSYIKCPSISITAKSRK